MIFNTLHPEIVKKLGISPSRKNMEIFLSAVGTIAKYIDIEEAIYMEIPLISRLRNLDANILAAIKNSISEKTLSLDIARFLVQRELSVSERKRYAAYYTAEHGLKYMSIACEELADMLPRRIVLADPFMGSGKTLVSCVEVLGGDRISLVWGVEPLPLPALVGYASLLEALNGHYELVRVFTGDSFVLENGGGSRGPLDKYTGEKRGHLPRSHMIVTNPPFTRWQYLEPNYRQFLLSLMSSWGYSRYLPRKDPGLHVISLFLCDRILEDNGILMAVLPASTFYTVQGEGFRKMLKEQYHILSLVDAGSRPSFSDDSGFKEVILVARKGHSSGTSLFCKLMEINTLSRVFDAEGEGIEINRVDVHQIPEFLDINWLSLTGKNPLREIVLSILEKGKKNGTLGTWKHLLGEESLVRGIEIYGPDFFFLPNRYWKIISRNESTESMESITDMKGPGIKTMKIMNIDTGVVISLSGEYLLPALRRPGDIARDFIVNVRTYMVSIPPVSLEELQEGIMDYCQWGITSGTAAPAIKAWPKKWYTHVYMEAQRKMPYGYLFLPDKIDLGFKNRGVLVHVSREKITASKNFYVAKIDRHHVWTLAAWLNSSVFLAIHLLVGRRISQTWSRLLEADYLSLPVPNPAKVSINSSEIPIHGKTKPLWQQVGTEERIELDTTVLEKIGIQNAESMAKRLNHALLQIAKKERIR